MAFQCPVCTGRNTRVERSEKNFIELDGVRITYIKRKVYCWICRVHFTDTEEKLERIRARG